MFCDNPEGWDGVEVWRDAQEKGDICIWLIHVDIGQKSTQCCNYPSSKNELSKKTEERF